MTQSRPLLKQLQQKLLLGIEERVKISLIDLASSKQIASHFFQSMIFKKVLVAYMHVKVYEKLL